ncbi:hypothetical protein HRbin36_00729 [bacterium HR36]|nr:hypothetical protein HRbin36_00729 [bacterium HR36]
MDFYMLELQVTDLGKSVAWYQHFGYRVECLKSEEGFALLRSGTSRLALKQLSVENTQISSASSRGIRLHFEVAALEAEIKRLRSLGLEPAKPMKISPEGYRHVVYHGPDGVEIGLFEWISQTKN